MEIRQVKHILIDISKRRRATTAEETWMMREFVPRLIQSFLTGIYLASLINDQHYQQLQEESPNGRLECLSQLTSMNYFQKEQQAIAWLAAKSLKSIVKKNQHLASLPKLLL